MRQRGEEVYLYGCLGIERINMVVYRMHAYSSPIRKQLLNRTMQDFQRGGAISFIVILHTFLINHIMA